METLEIIPYSREHWQGIVRVHDAARVRELTLAGLMAAFLPLSAAAEREGLFELSVFVAREAGEILGFVAFSREELVWLYVHPDHQRRGIGRKLACFALDRMGPGEKTVEVLEGNEPARTLYRSLGFRKEVLLHGHLEGNESFEASGWRMTRPG